MKYVVFSPVQSNFDVFNTINVAGFTSEKEDDYKIKVITLFWDCCVELLKMTTKVINVGDSVIQTTNQAIPTTANIKGLAKIEDDVYLENRATLEALTGFVCFDSSTDFLVQYPNTQDLTFNSFS